MSKFRTKPVVIEAFQVGSSRFYPEWLHEAVSANVVVTHAREGSDGWKEPFNHADIQTLEGVMRADRGDWIIRGVEGELYPCKDAIFRKTYEPAGDGEPPAQEPEPVRVWYMRDNHTFLELPLDIDEAISALRDEWPSGQTYGTLCSKEVNEEVHAHGEIEPFIAEVRAWYDRHGIGKGDSK